MTTSEPASAPEKITGCARLRGDQLRFVPLGEDSPGAEGAEVTGEGVAPTLSAGLARFVDIDFTWVHPSDEAVFVLDGELTASSDEDAVTGRPGDLMFVSRGARLRWQTRGECTVFVTVNITPEHMASTSRA